jgi:DNA-binding MarR family transcriptional regulator
MSATSKRLTAGELQRFYMALTRLLRNYQFRDRDRQMICGITVTQCYALEFLVHEGRLTILDLGYRLALNKSNASRVVEGLELIGAVSRAMDPENHRLRWIEPTIHGRELHGKITDGLKRDYAELLAPFNSTFVARVTSLLEALAERAKIKANCSVSKKSNAVANNRTARPGRTKKLA